MLNDQSDPTILPTYLDAHETSADDKSGLLIPLQMPAQCLSLNWRHSGWQARRKRIWSRMIAAEVSPNRINRFAACGECARVYVTTTAPHKLSIRANYCRDKLCTPCAIARSRRIADAVAVAARGKMIRMITLTLPGSPANASDRVVELQRAFRRLRQSAEWRSNVKGGVAFVELIRGQLDNRWHAHLHILAEGRYWTQSDLSNVWERCSRGARVVDIRLVRDVNKAVRYATKYASKPIHDDCWLDATDTLDVLRALESMRMANTFGDWRGSRLTRDPSTDDWEYLDRLEVVLQRALHSDPTATLVLRCLESGIPLTSLPTLTPPPDIIGPEHLIV